MKLFYGISFNEIIDVNPSPISTLSIKSLIQSNSDFIARWAEFEGTILKFLIFWKFQTNPIFRTNPFDIPTLDTYLGNHKEKICSIIVSFQLFKKDSRIRVLGEIFELFLRNELLACTTEIIFQDKTLIVLSGDNNEVFVPYQESV